MHQVHYRDRRTNRRVVHNETTITWHGPEIYRDHNWSADCNRSLEMYGPDEKHLRIEGGGPDNIIVIEKIVLGGQVVYHDEGIIDGVDSDAADIALARFHGAYDAVSTLFYGLGDTMVEYPVAIAQARNAHTLLSECPQYAHLLPVISEAIATAEAVERGEFTDDTIPVLERTTATMLAAVYPEAAAD